MKRVYTFTLDDDIPLSENIGSNIREIAYWLYTEIINFDWPILWAIENKNSGLIVNELLDINYKGIYTYKFTSDDANTDYRKYEPFMISNTSFGFTVIDGSISEEEILKILNRILYMTGFKYKFNINSIVYEKEIDRFKAIDMLTGKYSEIIPENPKKPHIRRKINPLIAGLFF